MMEEFFGKAKAAYKLEDYNRIVNAYNFAAKAHKDQKRISGESYIVHPLKVSDTLIDLGMDATTVIAALLHDVLEDTSVTEKEIEETFGKEVLEMVEAVTKLNKFKFNSQEEEQAENIRRLFLAMAKDIRVLLIKLADRLHNMRTLKHIPKENSSRKLRNLGYFAPLAGRLGISNIKVELEDLAMKYLYPEDYEYISSMIHSKRDERMVLVNKVAGIIQQRMKEANIKGEIKGGPNTFIQYTKDEEAGQNLRSDIRPCSGKGDCGNNQRLLYRSGRHPFDMETHSGPIQRLYSHAQAQYVSVASHNGNDQFRAGV